MAKRLRYSKIQLVQRNGALMLVSFLDEEGNAYTWAPKWSEVEDTFVKQINVERFNKPESQFLNKFAATVQKVVEGAQRITSAYKVEGDFVRYKEGKLIIETRGEFGGEHKLTPAFDVPVSFLDTWLDRYVEAFVVNDMVIRLREYFEGEVVREYPEPEGLPIQEEPADLPFE